MSEASCSGQRANVQTCPLWMVMCFPSSSACFMYPRPHYSVIHSAAKILILIYKSCKDTAGGWRGGGRGGGGGAEGEREREKFSLFWGTTLSPQHNSKPQSLPTSRALDPEYSRWWHFILRGRFWALQSWESV